MRKDVLAVIGGLMVMGFGLPAVAGVERSRSAPLALVKSTSSRNTSQLVFHDIDRDGRDDIVFLNNSMSRIEVLRRDPGGRRKPPWPAGPGRRSLHRQVSCWIRKRRICACSISTATSARIATAGTHRGWRNLISKTARAGLGMPPWPAVKRADQIIHVATADFDNDGGAVNSRVKRRRKCPLPSLYRSSALLRRHTRISAPPSLSKSAVAT